MADHYEMLKAIILAGRDEGFMEPGDDVSATNEILVIFSGHDQIYDEDEDQEIDDENNEIYEVYINAKALDDGFAYAEHDDYMGIEIGHDNEIHIRAVYEVDKDYLHTNMLEEYVESAKNVSLEEITKVIEIAYSNYFE
jgi:hypothetical protein